MTLEVLGIKKNELVTGVEFSGLATFGEYGMVPPLPCSSKAFGHFIRSMGV